MWYFPITLTCFLIVQNGDIFKGNYLKKMVYAFSIFGSLNYGPLQFVDLVYESINCIISVSNCKVYASVREDNTRALASGLSPVHTQKTYNNWQACEICAWC